MREKYKWTFRFLILTPLLVILSIYLMGGGHGFYLPTIFLFPIATISMLWSNDLRVVFMILALFQYPFYGYLIDKISNKIIIWTMFIIHILIAIIIIKFRIENWK
jgi:hypothetical protein